MSAAAECRLSDIHLAGGSLGNLQMSIPRTCFNNRFRLILLTDSGNFYLSNLVLCAYRFRNGGKCAHDTQGLAGERGETGQYVLSGSQSLHLLKSIQQSLAGRAGILALMPLSHREAASVAPGLTEYVLTGGYPRICDTGMPCDVFFRTT